MTEEHFTELAHVLTYPQVMRLGGGHFTPSTAFQLSSVLHRCAEDHVPLQRQLWPSYLDPRDWYLLDLLMTSQADAVVTRDKHLLKLRADLGLPIFEPRQIRWK